MINKAAFQEILSRQAIIDAPEELERFASDHSYAPAQRPALIIRPTSREEIINSVHEANRSNAGLIPVSSLPPRFRGDTVPSGPDAVVMDLSGMKRIQWINKRNRVALVEPGVTFGELEPKLEEQGLRAMFPLSPRAGKSMLAACMEREPFTIPKYSWDLGDPAAATELILGDGHIMRTGGGAGPGQTLGAQRKVDGAQKLPLSPMSMDVRRIAQGSQGSIGICSWISLRCELLPEYEQVFFVGSDDLKDLLELANRLLYLRLVDELYILNSMDLACLMKKDATGINRSRKKLPPWILVMSISGSGAMAKDQFDYRLGDAVDEAKGHGLPLLSKIGDLQATDYQARIVRQVSETPYWKLRPKGDVREIFFLTPLRRVPEFIGIARELVNNSRLSPSNAGIYLQPVLQGGACQVAFDLFMTEKEVKKHRKLFVDISRAIFEQGGYFSRPYGLWADMVYPHYETFATYARGIKKIFDPNRILNPGKLCFTPENTDAPNS